MASMNYFDSYMSNSTNMVVHFDGKDGNSYLRLRARSHTIYVAHVSCSVSTCQIRADDNSTTCAFTTGKSY
jgi:hypothetical protein